MNESDMTDILSTLFDFIYQIINRQVGDLVAYAFTYRVKKSHFSKIQFLLPILLLN
jgi:hypothetical protein